MDNFKWLISSIDNKIMPLKSKKSNIFIRCYIVPYVTYAWITSLAEVYSPHSTLLCINLSGSSVNDMFIIKPFGKRFLYHILALFVIFVIAKNIEH